MKPNLSGVKAPGCEFPVLVNKANIVSGIFSGQPADSLKHGGGGIAGAANTVTSTCTDEQKRNSFVDFTGTKKIKSHILTK